MVKVKDSFAKIDHISERLKMPKLSRGKRQEIFDELKEWITDDENHTLQHKAFAELVNISKSDQGDIARDAIKVLGEIATDETAALKTEAAKILYQILTDYMGKNQDEFFIKSEECVVAKAAFKQLNHLKEISSEEIIDVYQSFNSQLSYIECFHKELLEVPSLSHR